MNSFKTKIHTTIGLIGLSIITSSCSTPDEATSEQAFFEARTKLIEKYSPEDATFTALKQQVNADDKHSSEHWRWRVDQYLYGQYPEYQTLYDAYTEGKSFHQIYDLPAESLGPKKHLPAQLPELPKGFFTDNLQGNPHRGAHELINGKLYITYQGELTDPYIASFDLATQQWQGPYKAAESTLSKGERKIDSHGRPIIEQDSKGHLHIIYGGHGGEREDGLNPMSIDTPHAGGRMLHVMSEKPNDISSFVEVNDISPFASYTKSHKMDNGDIYFFTRNGTHKSPWVYYKMRSGEQRFGEPVVVTWPTPQQEDPIQVDTFYINPEKISATDIGISFLWHVCNFHEVHDKSTYSRINSYYMRLDTTTDTFYNAQNEALALPITLEQANEKTLAFDSTQREETPFGTKPLLLDDNTPAVAYEARTKTLREWRMTVFKDGHWHHSQPMVGIADRTLMDENKTPVTKIVYFELLHEASDKAMAIYRDSAGNTVFASVSRQTDNDTQWQVDEVHLSQHKTRLQMDAVRDELGELKAVVLNVKKDQAQRLYLWLNGRFQGLEG